MKNLLKEKLKAGKQTLGLFMSIPSPIVTEALSRAGYDWFVFDNEHSPLDVASTQMLMQAMGGSDTVPLVRVPWNDIVYIKKTLDIGAYGLIIPFVNSKEEAKQAVSYCKYPSSKGIRGIGPRRARMLDREYVETADDELLIMVQIETQKAVNNVEEILSVDGIDGYYIGPNDLSFSLGILRDFENPKFKKTIDKIVEAGKNAGVISGIHGAGLDNVKQRMKEGFQVICVGSDLGFVRRGAQSALQYLGKTK